MYFFDLKTTRAFAFDGAYSRISLIVSDSYQNVDGLQGPIYQAAGVMKQFDVTLKEPVSGVDIRLALTALAEALMEVETLSIEKQASELLKGE